MPRRSAARTAALAVSSITVAFAACAGCSRVDGYRLDPTPEIHTTSQTGDEIANATTVTFDTNFRSFLEALGRLTLVDRPSRLQNRPVPY